MDVAMIPESRRLSVIQGSAIPECTLGFPADTVLALMPQYLLKPTNLKTCSFAEP